MQHHRSRRKKTMTVVASAAPRLHLGRIQQFIGFAKPIQMVGIGDIGRYAPSSRRAIDLATLADDLIIHYIFIAGIKGKFNGPPVQRQLPAVIVQIAGIILGRQHMRQIDHEA